MASKKKIIAIAKDVLAQIKAKKLKFRKGYGYVEGRIEHKEMETIDLSAQLQDKLEVLQPACTVCALGSCFLSYVRLFNNVKVKECGDYAFSWEEEKDWKFEVDDLLSGILSEVFTPVQIGLIELAFETPKIDSIQYLGHFCCNLPRLLGLDTTYGLTDKDRVGKNWELVRNALAFGKRYRAMSDRVEAIMRNIVENDGKFVPPQRKKRGK